MKIHKKYAVLAGFALIVLLVGNVFAVDLRSLFDDEDAQDSMSVDEARLLIEKQQDMQTIPKLVWKQLLAKDRYHILWQQGTERAFTGELLNEKRKGVYVTAGCKVPVFSSEHKFKSGTGWPSFWEVVEEGNVVLKEDRSWGMKRIEVLSSCGEHLGHVFDDGPKPTGLRYCINSKALLFVPDEQAEHSPKPETLSPL